MFGWIHVSLDSYYDSFKLNKRVCRVSLQFPSGGVVSSACFSPEGSRCQRRGNPGFALVAVDLDSASWVVGEPQPIRNILPCFFLEKSISPFGSPFGEK